MDGVAWWATVHGVTKSQMRLQRLSTRARTHTTICEIGSWCEASVQHGGAQLSAVMTYKGGMGCSGREVQEGGDLCIHIPDSLYYTAKTNTIL